MTKQRFPLQSVLELSQTDRDHQQHQLAQTRVAEQASADTISELHEQMQELQSALRRALKPGEIAIDEVRSLQIQQRAIRLQLEGLQQEHAGIAARSEQELEALSEVNCQVRILEGMADRRQQAQTRERYRQETREADDRGARTAAGRN